MSLAALTWAFRQPLAGNHKVVLLVLADHFDDERGICYPSVGHIAGRAYISESTVVRCLRELELGGYFTRQERFSPEGRQMSTLYRLKVALDVRRQMPLPATDGGGCQIDSPVNGDTPEGVNADTPYEPSQETLKTTGKARARGVRLPEDWTPTPVRWAKTVELIGRSAALTELTKFRNYWLSKAGKDAAKLDWGRTFDNWIITASERRPTHDRTPQAGAQRSEQSGNLARIFTKINAAIDAAEDGIEGGGGYPAGLSAG